MSNAKKSKRSERDEAYADIVRRTNIEQALPAWTAFIEAVNVPQDVFPALVTGRTELLDIMQPRAFNEEEAKAILNLIKVLIRTNLALREHAQETAHLVDTWMGGFKQIHSVGQRIVDFGNFRTPLEEDEA
jgi:hypothetical protein